MSFFFSQNVVSPLYIQLYEYMKIEIESGRLRAGEKLPSIRSLSQELRVSKQTIDSAYQQLLAEGYVESRPRSGLFILPLEEELKIAKKPTSPSSPSHYETTILYDFHYGVIDKERFPLKTWKRCLNATLDGNPQDVLYYGNRQGDFNLREEIRKYVLRARGISCSTEQIFICSGTQQSISFISRLLQLQNQQVAMEEPGYVEVRSVWMDLQCNVIPISLEKGGISINELQKSKAKAVYVTPSHQFPLGMVLPIRKRIQLLQWAIEESSYIIEDDYDSEFRYIGQPIPSLKSPDKDDRVIYCGTFSKCFLPAARVSYVILPENLVAKGKHSIEHYSQSASPIIQRALAMFMNEGFFEKHVRRMKTAYQAKHKVLIQAIDEYLGEQVEIIGQRAGLHILLDIKNKNVGKLIQQAKENGIRVYSPAQHWFNEAAVPFILLGFGGLSEQQIREGICELAKLFQGIKKECN